MMILQRNKLKTVILRKKRKRTAENGMMLAMFAARVEMFYAVRPAIMFVICNVLALRNSLKESGIARNA